MEQLVLGAASPGISKFRITERVNIWTEKTCAQAWAQFKTDLWPAANSERRMTAAGSCSGIADLTDWNNTGNIRTNTSEDQGGVQRMAFPRHRTLTGVQV